MCVCVCVCVFMCVFMCVVLCCVCLYMTVRVCVCVWVLVSLTRGTAVVRVRRLNKRAYIAYVSFWEAAFFTAASFLMGAHPGATRGCVAQR